MDNKRIDSRAHLASRSLSATKAHQCAKISELRKLLVQAGYNSLSRQATALGLSRSTTWALLQANHKCSGLSGGVIKRMLRSPELPSTVRQWIEEYIAEKLAGTYGHTEHRLKIFQAQVEFHAVLPIHQRGAR